ncbi:hypothetical protein JCM10296v2_006156 [Rhodotorula toruloides]
MVKPSRKNVDRSRGSYAAVRQTDSHGRPSTDSARDSPHADSDPEHSPNGSSDAEHSEDLEKGKSSSRFRKSREGGVAGGGSAGSDDEHDDGEKKESSWTKWALIAQQIEQLGCDALFGRRLRSFKLEQRHLCYKEHDGCVVGGCGLVSERDYDACGRNVWWNSVVQVLTLSEGLPADSGVMSGSPTTQALPTGEAGLPVQLGGTIGAATPTGDAFASTPVAASATAHAGGATGSAGSNETGHFSNPDSQTLDDSEPATRHNTSSRPTYASRPSYEGQPGWQTTSGGTSGGETSSEGSTKFTTTATWFAVDQHRTACGTTYTSNSLVAALSPSLYGSDGDSVSPLCGAKVNVWSPDSNVTISVKVGDVCDACPTTTSIDLSQAAFLRLAGASPKNRDAALDKGVFSIQWWLEDAELQAQLPVGFSDWDGSMGEANEV